MLILKILKGDPTAKDWAKIGKMLEEGFTTGIDRPAGINWSIEWRPSSNASEPKPYLVTFKDGSVDQVDALGPTQARAIVEVGIRDGTFHGEIASIDERR